MPRYTGTVTTARPPHEVFDYLASFDRVAEWDPGVREAHALSTENGGDGATFRVVTRFLGRDVPLVYRTVALEPPRRVVLEAAGDSVVSRDAITVRPLPEGGAQVTYDAELRLRGPLRLAELPMRLAFRRIGDRARAGLEEALA